MSMSLEPAQPIDDVDRAILHYLQQDGRTPYTTIAAALNVAEGTVRKRVNRLLEDGVLRVVGIINPARMGPQTLAIVGVKIVGSNVDGVIAQLTRLPEVRYLAICAGTYDIILEVVVPSNEALFVFLTKTLRSIPDVIGSDTSLVMKVSKQRYEWGELPERGDP
jgi:Lrp/AsnC family transcriptional regulator for asnA, asnC and gidA